MKKLILYSLLFVIPLESFCQEKSIGGNRRGDSREVVGWIGSRPSYVPATVKNVWNTKPYNQIVKILPSGGTGEFISPRHILTNAHVAKECGMNNKPKCSVVMADGTKLTASVKFYGTTNIINNWNTVDKGKDWQILETEGGHCAKNWFQIAKTTTLPQDNVWRAGWASLRVLTDEDVKNIRAAYNYWLRNGGTGPLGKDMFSNRDKYKLFLDKFRELSGGKDFVTDYLKDSNTLKVRKICSMSRRTNTMFKHSCDSWPGDSGSTLQDSSNRIVGLNNSGYEYIGYGADDGSFGLKTENFSQNRNLINAIDSAIQSCKVENQVGAILNAISKKD